MSTSLQSIAFPPAPAATFGGDDALDAMAKDLKNALAEIAAQSVELTERDRELARLRGWFDLVLDHMLRGLSVFDADQRLLFCNKAYREIYDLPDHLTAYGTPLSELVRFYALKEKGKDSPEESDAQRTWIERHVRELARGKVFAHTQHLKNGKTVLVTNKPLPGGGWMDIQEDITERRKVEQRITWLAHHDPLTEVANRLQFHDALETALQNLRPTMGFALHWIDLDRFKDVNDTFGHPVGDVLLKSVAARLLTAARATDVVARLGGDEFIVLQAGAEEWKTAEQFAKRLLKVLREPHTTDGQTLLCPASIGIALAPQHGRTADELMKNADRALYHVKRSGRNGFAFAEL